MFKNGYSLNLRLLFKKAVHYSKHFSSTEFFSDLNINEHMKKMSQNQLLLQALAYVVHYIFFPH